jgi:hypothetical protein
MRYIQPFKAGTSVGAVIGLFHLMWVCMVALGWAKPVMDFVLRLHFIRLDYELAPFAAGTAAALVALTFAIGFLFGTVFALVWNWLAAPAAERAPGGARVGT